MAKPTKRAGNKSFTVKGKTVSRFTPDRFKGQKKQGRSLGEQVAAKVAAARTTPGPYVAPGVKTPETTAPGAFRPDLGMTARGPNVVGPTTNDIGSGQGQSRRRAPGGLGPRGPQVPNSQIGSGQGQSRRKKLPRPPGGRGTLAGVVRRRGGLR